NRLRRCKHFRTTTYHTPVTVRKLIFLVSKFFYKVKRAFHFVGCIQSKSGKNQPHNCPLCRFYMVEPKTTALIRIRYCILYELEQGKYATKAQESICSVLGADFVSYETDTCSSIRSHLSNLSKRLLKSWVPRMLAKNNLGQCMNTCISLLARWQQKRTSCGYL
ncbi:unnamed protein product, partial [Mesocestoides corti]|uniref:HTH_48 domain-containing protein n=1 Tax=Mesocestoides corti TaxID=53468 RepID=A0A0R3U3C0_MESCO